MTNAQRQEPSRFTSVVGESAVVIGNATGQGDLEIRGRVQGDVVVAGRVHVAESGIVLGRIEAHAISIAGKVRGDLEARELLELFASADVEGNLASPRLTITAGARAVGGLRTGESLPKSLAPEELPKPAVPSLESPSLRAELPLPKAPQGSPEPKRAEPSSATVEPKPAKPIAPSVEEPRRRPRAIPSFQKGARASLKEAD